MKMTRNSIEVQRARKVKEPDSHYIGLIGQLNGLIHTRVNEDSESFHSHHHLYSLRNKLLWPLSSKKKKPQNFPEK